MAKVLLTDLFRGLERSIAHARYNMQMQHKRLLERYYFYDEELDTYTPKTIRVNVPSSSNPEQLEPIDVPLMTLVPISSLEIDELDIEFEARLTDVEVLDEGDIDEDGINRDRESRLYIDMKKMGFFSSTTPAKISMKFKGGDAPEGIMRINDLAIKGLN